MCDSCRPSFALLQGLLLDLYWIFSLGFYPNPLRTRTISLLFLGRESLECERTRREANIWPMMKEGKRGSWYCSLCPSIRLVLTSVMYLLATFKIFLLTRDYFPEFIFTLSLNFPNLEQGHWNLLRDILWRFNGIACEAGFGTVDFWVIGRVDPVS